MEQRQKNMATPKQNKWKEAFFKNKVLNRAGINNKPLVITTSAWLRSKGIKLPKGVKL